MADLAQEFRPYPTPPGFEEPYAGPRLVDTTQTVQAAAEGVAIEDGDYLEFFGEKFRLAERVSVIPMMAFANAGKRGLDSDDMAGLAAMYALIRSVIHRPPLFDENGVRVRDENGKALRDEAEWRRFEELAEDEQADGEEIMAFVNQAMGVLAARPRKPREISSGGSRPTSESSKAVSSSPVMPPGMEDLTPVSKLGR